MMLLKPTLEDMGFTLWGAAWREPIGCQHCAQTGYLGRLGLYEIVPITPELEHDLREREPEESLTRTARAGGFQSLVDDGYAKARAGLTTLAEVRRAVSGGETTSTALAGA